MTKSEARMTNQTRSPKSETASARRFDPRHWAFVIHSSFAIRHSSFLRAAWLLLALTVLPQCAPSEKPHSKEPAVRTFLERYFSTWSAKDMDGYGACFHPQARITFVHEGRPETQGLTDFLHGQKLGHLNATTPMTEVPTGMRIMMDDRTAQAQVRWKLTQGSRIVTGTDCFTLIETPEGWKIASLVFYND